MAYNNRNLLSHRYGGQARSSERMCWQGLLLLKAISKAPSLTPLASSGPWQHYSILCSCLHMTVFPMHVSMSNPPLAIRASCMDYSSSQGPYLNNQIYNDLICK